MEDGALTYRDFYPRPPRGGRPTHNAKQLHAYIFLSTPSARRATVPNLVYNLEEEKFLSTPSARRATAEDTQKAEAKQISIHALREEGDSKNREKIPAFIPL